MTPSHRSGAQGWAAAEPPGAQEHLEESQKPLGLAHPPWWPHTGWVGLSLPSLGAVESSHGLTPSPDADLGCPECAHGSA